MDMELCVNSMKIAEVVQLPHHIIAGAIEAKMSSYCKKLTNRKLRHYKGEIHKGGNYRRVFDMWWELD